MKKNKLLLNIIFAVIICIVVIPLLVLVGSKWKYNTENQAEIYYLTAPGYSLKEITKTIEEDKSIEKSIMQLLQEMKTQPQKEGLLSAIPQDVSFLSVRVQDRTAMVELSPSYLSLSNVQKVLVRCAVVWTLTSLESIDNVEMQIEGHPLQSSTGDMIGQMNRANVNIDGDISAETTEYAILQLYFADAQYMNLIAEDRVVEANTNQAKEKTIVEQLITGPLEKGHYATLPLDTKVRDVTTTKDGICYVNLSQDFLSKSSGDHNKEVLMVYSVVNSLCALDTVNKVQFFVEGEKIEDVKGNLDFSKPFTEKEDIRSMLEDKK